MRSRYDAWGWYDGQVADDDVRSTPESPPTLAQTTVPGELRGYWTGQQWTARPYVPPGAAPAPDPTPQSVSAAQARFQLIDDALDDLFAAALAAITPDRRRRRLLAEWATARAFDRRRSALTAGLNALGHTRQQINAFFVAAAAQEDLA